jgi:hypothetical protein
MGKDEIKKHRNVLNIELLDRRLYNPEIALGDFSDIKGDLSVARYKK